MTQSTPQDTPASVKSQGFGIGYLSLLVIVFVLGIVIGFLGRPAIVGDTYVEVVVTAVPEPAGQAVAQSSGTESGSVRSSQTEENEPNTSPTPTIMEFVLADARHFQGNIEAPVTIVEFSDFK